MPVSFKSQNLVPAPLVQISKNYIKNSLGLIDHSEWNFSLTGNILNQGIVSLDSPATSGLYGLDMRGVLAEQARIRSIFTGDGGLLQITAPTGSGNLISAYCEIDSLEFSNGTWNQIDAYQVSLKSRAIEGSNEYDSGLNSFNESWNVTENIDGTRSVSHQLQAQGALSFPSGVKNDPLYNAKLWVNARKGTTDPSGNLYNTSGSGVFFNLATLSSSLSSGTNYWNRSQVETVDPSSYTYGLTENYIYSPFGSAAEVFNASVSYEQNNLRKANVNINGKVFGYSDVIENLDSRNSRAKTYFENTVSPNIYTRAQTFLPAGFSTSTLPSTKQVSYELTEGVLSYSYSYSASNGVAISGAIEENIEVNDVGSTDVFASIAIPGRANGPITQFFATKTSPERSVSISAQLSPESGAVSVGGLRAMYLSKPNTDAIITQFQPENGYFYIKADSENYNPYTRRYGRNVSWHLDPRGGSIAGMPFASGHTSLT